jgi:hypothetical protein
MRISKKAIDIGFPVLFLGLLSLHIWFPGKTNTARLATYQDSTLRERIFDDWNVPQSRRYGSAADDLSLAFRHM